MKIKNHIDISGEKNPFWGHQHTEETKRKISEAKKGKKLPPFTEEHKRKIGEASKKRIISEETKEKIRKIKTGKRASEETKKKMSELRKGEKHWNWGKHWSEEVKEKMRNNHADFSGEKHPMFGRIGEKNPLFGTHLSEETKQKISKINKGRKHSDETKRKISNSHKGKKLKPFTDEHKRKIGAKIAERFKDKTRTPNWQGGISKTRGYQRISNLKRKNNLIGMHTLQEWQWMMEKYGYKCLACGKQEPEIKLTLDHVIPISKGGSNKIDNVQPLCSYCNKSKHAKTIDYRILWAS